MLYSGKKTSRFATKNINILTLVLSEKKILNETKNHKIDPTNATRIELLAIRLLFRLHIRRTKLPELDVKR
jgi:hypothetical protein